MAAGSRGSTPTNRLIPAAPTAQPTAGSRGSTPTNHLIPAAPTAQPTAGNRGSTPSKPPHPGRPDSTTDGGRPIPESFTTRIVSADDDPNRGIVRPTAVNSPRSAANDHGTVIICGT
jgi:hypothetical protein